MEAKLKEVFQEWREAVDQGNNFRSEQHADAILFLLYTTICSRTRSALASRTTPGDIVTHEDIEDVCQYTRIEVFDALYRFDPAKGTLLNYLLSVVDGAIVAAIEEGEAIALSPSGDQLPTEENPQFASDCLEDSDLSMVIKAALKKLPFTWGRVVYLRYFKGYTQAEVAAFVKLNQSTVSRIERKALIHLHNIMGTDPRER
jgi:RNA polymerase sigma factor (sigma-70 family)